MKVTIALLCVLFLLSGCKLTRVEGEVQDVEVKVGSKESSESNNKHCPPGLAKQGRCKN
ncbi:hypothetical protein [Pseudoalteromonas sp. T1lg23B]|uniref:hypothetical protein n=1 Tax=Pseudoalteromonas sp. T1lg23B TaxID=2077097 RepID=UPI0018FEE14B|nr:hypothetical protein [Pseudoalteromonas sp. T1lg23B]